MKNNFVDVEKIREECVKEFIRAYEEAGIKGMCADGRIEYAIDSVRSINLKNMFKNESESDEGNKNNTSKK